MGLFACSCSRFFLCFLVRLWTAICQALKPKSKIPQAPESLLKFVFGSNRLAIMEFLGDVYGSYGLFSYEKTIYIVDPSLAKKAMDVLEKPPSVFAKKDNAEMTCDPNTMAREYLSESNLERKRDTIIAVIEKAMDKMEKFDVCNVSELFLKMVIDMHGQILMGVDFQALDDKQEKFIDALVTMIRKTFMKHEISPKSQEFLGAIGTFGKTIAEQLSRSLNDAHSGKSLASHLNPCGTDATMGKLQSMFAAGTLAMESNLSMMLDVLARKPKVQEELQREIDEVINDIKSNSYRSSPKLESTMNECLRFYPPSPTLLCKAKEDVTIGNITIPSGSSVDIFLLGLQKSCSRMKNAKQFCFDRFLETSDSWDASGQSESFMPFGAGSRVCSGRNIVWFEMKLAMSLFLHRFTFHTVAQTKDPSFLLDWAHGAMARGPDVVLGVKKR